ncbi:MAG: hypothetical protein M3496_13530 [Pseudomonadota bacterium]|nr:hypothetical protein [Pseudomonadota bacterium]
MAPTPGKNIQFHGAALAIGKRHENKRAIRAPTTLDCLTGEAVWQQVRINRALQAFGTDRTPVVVQVDSIAASARGDRFLSPNSGQAARKRRAQQ